MLLDNLFSSFSAPNSALHWDIQNWVFQAVDDTRKMFTKVSLAIKFSTSFNVEFRREVLFFVGPEA